MVNPGKGVRLAIDVGTVRIGVARSDQDQIMALPVTTVLAGDLAQAEIIELVNEFRPEIIYVGKPVGLGNSATPSTELAINFAVALADKVEVPIRLLDERLTTVSAQSQLHASGKNTKQGKNVIDQVAAVILLDHAMSIERSTGNLAGEVASPLIQ